MYLKQSTAATVKLGPFVDDADGKTAETSLTIQKADVRLSKNGGDMAAASADQGASDAGAAHDELGYYDVSLDAADTDTLGRLKVMVSESGALPVWAEYTVLAAAVYDALVGGGDTLPVDVTQYGGANGTFAGGRPEVNVSHWGAVAVSSASVRANLININGAAVNAASAQLGVNVVNAGGSAWATASTAIVSGVVSGVFGQDMTALFLANSFGQLVKTNIDTTIGSRSSHSAADVWAAGTRSLTDKDGFSLAAAGLDLVEIETGINCRQAISGILAASLGVLSGAAGLEVTILGAGVLTTRIVATVDASGNRSAVTLTLPA